MPCDRHPLSVCRAARRAIDDLISYAAEWGGHMCVGLQDVSLGIYESNASLVCGAVDRLTRDGHGLAKPNEVRLAIENKTSISDR
ncbi:MAG: hypothetical protein J0H51_18670 [Rhizobiales bacterium]|nr:hypothetical protein [Hyphomicrobiales bacterium]